ncbi:MAG: hypothetical protein WAN20_22235 [Pseudonocardiaceae bacterium]|nr:hypothetical protein [Pseudonocardiaceae bacterium]
MTAEDVDWLVAHLRVMVAASPAVWAGRGMTLLQLSVLHRISALAPVTAQPTAHRPSSVLPQHSTETHSGDN